MILLWSRGLCRSSESLRTVTQRDQHQISSNEHQEPKTDFTYIMYGTLEKPGELPPKGEFFCKRREAWMPEIPG